MAEHTKLKTAPSQSIADYLKIFLQLYWLRPESAVFAARKAHFIGQQPLNGTTLDLSCGDGLFTFITMGGEIDPKFDMYYATGNLDKVHKKNMDMFDACDASYAVPIIKQPEMMIDYGIDMKESMKKKSSALNIYKNLLQHDCNKGIPLDDETITTLHFFYTINHYSDMTSLIPELYRILEKNGKAFISIYDPSCITFYEQLELKFPKPWMNIVERGMRTLWPTMLELTEWRNLFKSHGLKIHDIIPLVSKKIAPYWNIGFRPIAPLLVKLVNGLREHDEKYLLSIKDEWVYLLHTLILPMTELEPSIPEEAATYMFILEK